MPIREILTIPIILGCVIPCFLASSFSFDDSRVSGITPFHFVSFWESTNLNSANHSESPQGPDSDAKTSEVRLIRVSRRTRQTRCHVSINSNSRSFPLWSEEMIRLFSSIPYQESLTTSDPSVSIQRSVDIAALQNQQIGMPFWSTWREHQSLAGTVIN